MKLWILPALVVLLASLPTGAQAAQAIVKANANNEWSPQIQRIEPGDRILWKNPTDVKHNVTAYGANWSWKSPLEVGETAAKRFPKKGLYRYRCTIHGFRSDGQCFGMCGAIRVRPL